MVKRLHNVRLYHFFNFLAMGGAWINSQLKKSISTLRRNAIFSYMKYGSWISVFHLEAKLATVVLLSLCKLYMTKIAAGVIEVLELKGQPDGGRKGHHPGKVTSNSENDVTSLKSQTIFHLSSFSFQLSTPLSCLKAQTGVQWRNESDYYCCRI